LTAQTEGRFLCDRCGEEYHRNVLGQVKTLFVAASDGPVPEKEDVRILPPEAPFIDVLQDATDAVQLAVSAKNLCRESCRGLCVRCGKNLNEGPCACKEDPPDPRWDALKDIRFDA
jgi:uncharacterized protein